jgi:predicted Rossmann fold nucleotide-binding protein DprA/Smf involved in DNA uptake
MARWRRTPAAWRQVGAEVVVLPQGSDDPIALGGAAASAWRLLEEPASVASMAEHAGAPIAEVQAGLVSLAILGLAEVQ